MTRLVIASLIAATFTACGFDSRDTGEAGSGSSLAASFCEPYADNIQELADTAGCAGAGGSSAALEAQCNKFVADYVEPLGCDSQYARYLQCASNATTCNPCRPDYCTWNSCMCAASDHDPNLCLSNCF